MSMSARDEVVAKHKAKRKSSAVHARISKEIEEEAAALRRYHATSLNMKYVLKVFR